MQPLGVGRPANINLSFGLINVPVSVHGAVGDADTGLHTVCTHKHDPTRIKRLEVCPACGNDGKADGPEDSIHEPFEKARDTGDSYVVIPPEKLEEAKEAAKAFKKGMTVTAHPVEQVTAALMPSGKSYYLSLKTQVEGTLKAYHSLVTIVRSRPDLAFMTKLTLSTAVSVFQLTVAGEHTLVLRQMGDAELVRMHPVIAPIDLSETERTLLPLAVDAVVEPFDVAVHGTGLSTVVADYAATQTPVPAGGVPDPVAAQSAPSNVVDLIGALEAMAAARKAQNAPAASTPVEAAQAEVKKAAQPLKAAPRRRRRPVATENKEAS